VLLCLVLAVAVLISYNPIKHNGFVNWDDDIYITNNIQVRSGLTLATVKWAFTTYSFANWAPLSWLSHALDCQLFGLNAEGHHYVSVLIHAANAVVLFLLLQYATGFRWRSLMVAALFALHPVNVESVAWAAERKNVLSMLFFLLALYAYVWYTRKPGLLRYAPVFFLFAMGLLSKSQVITFPFVLWLWDYWPLQRIFPSTTTTSAVERRTSSPVRHSAILVLEKLPLFALCAASAIITTRAEAAGGAIKSLSQYGLLLRLETAVVSYVRYLGNALWPSKLAALYPHPTKLYPAWQVIAALLVLLLITALVLYQKNRRYLAVGWFWFLGTMVPMIGLVQVGFQAMADRFAYIPYIGLFILTTWLISDWAEDWVDYRAKDWAKAHRLSARMIAIPTVLYLLLLGTLTYRQVSYWHDIESFWRRTVAVTKDNYVAEVNLGEFLYSHGRADEAAVHFRSALAIFPEGPSANLNLGAYEDSRGNISAAIEQYEKVTRASDAGLRATAYSSLGFVYRRMGQTAMAKQCFETASQVAPERARALVGLGLLAQDRGDLAEAVRLYSLALTRQRSDVELLLLAQGLLREGRTSEARSVYEEAARSESLQDAEKETRALLTGK
jgi:tetratricopeptide (TPR) repeat protein